jgi:hypothetical protein
MIMDLSKFFDAVVDVVLVDSDTSRKEVKRQFESFGATPVQVADMNDALDELSIASYEAISDPDENTCESWVRGYEELIDIVSDVLHKTNLDVNVRDELTRRDLTFPYDEWYCGMNELELPNEEGTY